MNKSGFVDVDGYQAEVSLQQAAADCGLQLDMSGGDAACRIDCLFRCAGDHAGKREISVDATNPAKQWQCHAYGCGRHGNLLQLMYGWLEGAPPPEKLRGEQFRRVRDHIAGVLAGDSPTPVALQEKPASAQQSAEQERNVPLCASGDPKTRSLVEPPIWDKFATDVAAMSPAPSTYVRRHRVLTPEAMEKWHVGVLPSDGGGDKRGFSLRNKITYPLLSDDGEVLAFIPRDPLYEQKVAEYERQKPEERDPDKRPVKHRFPKGFKRSIELFGQQRSRIEELGESIRQHAIIVVEGFNDVIRLDNDGIYSLAICSNIITDRQVEKLAERCRELDTHVSLMFDCDEEGDRGAADAAWKLLQAGVSVRPVWGRRMFDGAFAGRQPESVDHNELHTQLLAQP